MTTQNAEYAYWMALSHMPKWGPAKINQLIIDILYHQKMMLAEFFNLNAADLTAKFNLTPPQVADIANAKTELPGYSFLAENLLEQGFQIIPISAPEYSATLKQNLKVKDSPPLLYVKGNTRLLNEDSVAVVGSRQASEIALEFTRNIARNCALKYEVVVSGFAKGVDKMALDATLEVNGHSIVVLPQGILTFGSGIKKYYKQIIAGDVLILSTFHPKSPWAVGLAMSRNTHIYGLARTIYVAESDSKGGTWAGVLDGIKKGRHIFVRQPEPDEKNANQLLIMQGAFPVDMQGTPVARQDHQIETQLKQLLAQGPLSIQALFDGLHLKIEIPELQKFLANLDFIGTKTVKREKYYFLKNSVQGQSDLFS